MTTKYMRNRWRYRGESLYSFYVRKFGEWLGNAVWSALFVGLVFVIVLEIVEGL